MHPIWPDRDFLGAKTGHDRTMNHSEYTKKSANYWNIDLHIWTPPFLKAWSKQIKIYFLQYCALYSCSLPSKSFTLLLITRWRTQRLVWSQFSRQRRRRRRSHRSAIAAFQLQNTLQRSCVSGVTSSPHNRGGRGPRGGWRWRGQQQTKKVESG